MATVGDVRVELTGKATKLQGAISKVTKAMKAFGAIALKVAKVAGAAFVGIGLAAIKSGATIQRAMRKIQVGTGATGKALGVLKESFRTVFRGGPDAAELVGETLANVNTLFGSTGEVLEKVTRAILDVSRLLGGDAATNSLNFGRAMRAWQIPAEESTGILDLLFATTQTSAISFEELTTTLGKYQSELKNVGLTLPQAVDLLGRFSANGLKAKNVMPGLSFAIKTWAGENKNAGEELRKSIKFIQTATDKNEALNESLRVFGSEAGVKAFDIIRSGAIAMEDLGENTDKSKGSIDKSIKSVKLWGEVWGTIRNNITDALGPIGEAIINLFKAQEKPILEFIQNVRVKLPKAVESGINAIAAFLPVIGPGFIQILNKVSIAIKTFALAVSLLAQAAAGLTAIWKAVRFGRVSEEAQTALENYNQLKEVSKTLAGSIVQDFKDILNATKTANAIKEKLEIVAKAFGDVAEKQKKVKEVQEEVVTATAMAATEAKNVDKAVDLWAQTITIAGQKIQVDINGNLDGALKRLKAIRLETERAARAAF